MTIGTNTVRASFACDGVSTVFPINLPAYAAADFQILLTVVATGVSTTLALNSDYTLTASGTNTPTFWTLTRIGPAWAAGQTLQAIVSPLQTQQTQYAAGQGFPSLAVQTNFDRLTQMVQRVQDQVSRAVRAPDGDLNPNMLLASPSLRASSYLATDIAGNVTTFPIAPGTLNPAQRYDDVRLFGAKLDGVTNDTAAVAAALALYAQAYVPYTAAGMVLSNLNLTGTLYSSGSQMQIFAAAGSSYAIKITGYAATLQGFNCQDVGNTVSVTTTAGSAIAGAATILVTSAIAGPGPGIVVGQRLCVELASGYWHASYVSSVAGTTIGLYSPIPTGAAVNAGARVWSSFGFIYVTINGATRTQLVNIRSLVFSNCWAGILIDAPTNAADINQLRVENIRFPGSGRMFLVCNGRNGNNNDFDNVNGFAGFATSFLATGNGATTQYSFPDNVFLVREATITLNGVTKTAGVDYSWLAGSNRTIVFGAAPGVGVAVAGSAWTYGVEGIAEDKVPLGSAVQPQGGNNYTDCATLQAQRGWNFRNAQLFSLEDTIGDTCSDASYCFDACTYGLGSLNSAFIGWAANGIKMLNGSYLKCQVDQWGLMGPGNVVLNSGAAANAGAAQNAMNVDATSNLDFSKATTLFSTSLAALAQGTTWYFGPNGSQAAIGAAQWVTPYNATLLKLNVQANVAAGAGQTYTYQLLDVNLNVLATAVVSGAAGSAAFGADVYIPVQSTTRDGALSVKLVTSAGAGVGFHRIAVIME